MGTTQVQPVGSYRGGTPPVTRRTASEPRFGSNPAGVMATLGPVNRGIARMYSWFETSYEPGFILLSKIFGNTVPRTAITRNAEERKEVLFNELTQGATLFLTLPLVSPIANKIQSLFYGRSDVTAATLKQANATVVRAAGREGGIQAVRRLKILKLGKSFGVSAFAAAALIATTYLRNYRTIKRTGFSDYKQVVGLGEKRDPTPEERAQAERAAQRNLNIVFGLLAGGALAGAGIMGGAAYLAKNVDKFFRKGGLFTIKSMERGLNHLFKHWALVGKNSNQINSVFKSTKQTLWVWGIPSYLGWFLGCRDKYEVAEQASKFATFVAGYIWVPKLAGWLRGKLDKLKLVNRESVLPHLFENGKPRFDMTKLYSEIINKMGKKAETRGTARQLIKLYNANNMAILGLNLFVIGALPIIFNIFFSAWRHKREEAARPVSFGAVPFNHPGGTLRRKSFQAWGQQ